MVDPSRRGALDLPERSSHHFYRNDRTPARQRLRRALAVILAPCDGAHWLGPVPSGPAVVDRHRRSHTSRHLVQGHQSQPLGTHGRVRRGAELQRNTPRYVSWRHARVGPQRYPIVPIRRLDEIPGCLSREDEVGLEIISRQVARGCLSTLTRIGPRFQRPPPRVAPPTTGCVRQLTCPVRPGPTESSARLACPWQGRASSDVIASLARSARGGVPPRHGALL